MIRQLFAASWFPPAFALANVLRHAGMIASDYWIAQQTKKNFNALVFIREDFARPLFEPYGFCEAWSHYGFGQSAAFGLDLPVYVLATLLHSALSGHASCVDALTTPRWHVMTTVLAIPVWFFAARWLRRMANRQWRNPTSSRGIRIFLSAGLLAAPVGATLLAFGALALLTAEPGQAVRLLGTGAWLVAAGALSADPLRLWPWKNAPSHQ